MVQFTLYSTRPVSGILVGTALGASSLLRSVSGGRSFTAVRVWIQRCSEDHPLSGHAVVRTGAYGLVTVAGESVDLVAPCFAPDLEQVEFGGERETVDNDARGMSAPLMGGVDDEAAGETERDAHLFEVGPEARHLGEVVDARVDGEATGGHRHAFVEHQAVPRVGVVVIDAEPRCGGVVAENPSPRLEPESAHGPQHVTVVATHPDEGHDHRRNRLSSKRLMNEPNPIRPAARPTA